MTANDYFRSSTPTTDETDMFGLLDFVMSLCATRLGKLTGPAARADRRVSLLRTSVSMETSIIPALIDYLTFVNHWKSVDRANKQITVSPDGDIMSLCNSSLQLLGNIVYGCTAAQDRLRLREEDQLHSDAPPPSVGLLQILSLCNTDVRNPLRREFAILCLRNACEGNLPNQAYIESLVLQGVAQVDEQLARAGMGVSFDPASGKIEFKSTLPEATLSTANSLRSSTTSRPLPSAAAIADDASNDSLGFM